MYIEFSGFPDLFPCQSVSWQVVGGSGKCPKRMKAVASLAKELDIVLTFSDKVRVEDSWQGFSLIFTDFSPSNTSASPWGYLKVFLFFFGGVKCWQQTY